MREIALHMDHELGDQLKYPQTGKELIAWRKALGLRQREIAQLLGVHLNTIVRAERRRKLKGQVLLGVQLLQHQLLHGEIDLSPILKKRRPLGRPKRREV
jgi:transcriptional regulator with XRE-family HTH domain